MALTVEQVLSRLSVDIGARPVGSTANQDTVQYLRTLAEQWGYTVQELPFECLSWEYGESVARVGDRSFPVFPGPYSPPLQGRLGVVWVGTVEELRTKNFQDALVVLHHELAAEPLMPTDFPFFFPDEHKEIIDLLRNGGSAGVLALTGRHPLCGLEPFPLFEDGALELPNAYASAGYAEILQSDTLELDLNSRALSSTGVQLIFSKPDGLPGLERHHTTPGDNESLVEDSVRRSRIVVCAHMDTKYGTPGALDNAAGVAVMMRVMELMRAKPAGALVDFLPFNGEEYYGVSGQLAYLQHLKTSQAATLGQPTEENPQLVVNIDGVGLRNSAIAVSSYNRAGPDFAALPGGNTQIAAGESWVAGDHSMFAFAGTPCLALTSSSMMSEGTQLTHTAADTMANIDIDLLEYTAVAVAHLIEREAT